ncbi:thiamine phosphate synthase [Pengzhenrongella sp.]|jgi:thiamine-phosphate pyrophosphorylase|uniref:thiamine phosphate synthase n=1 Tax=Pengzhenrongella sp. TaxID=2888820 RepID=UPI002F952C2F
MTALSGSPIRTLPPLLVLTDRSLVPPGRDLIGTLREAIAAGARAVVLRERDLPNAERARLAEQVQAMLAPVGGVLLLASAAPLATAPFAGLHLRATDPAPAARPGLLGRSTHSLDELLRAADEGCDYVTLSPVAPTRSKPGYGPALGVAGFGDLLAAARHARSVPPAVFALGGVDEHNAGSFLDAGADGVAVMGSVMAAQDPGRNVAALLAALGVGTPAAVAG